MKKKKQRKIKVWLIVDKYTGELLEYQHRKGDSVYESELV